MIALRIPLATKVTHRILHTTAQWSVLVLLVVTSQVVHAEMLDELSWDALQTRALLLYQQHEYHEALDVARRALQLAEHRTGNASLQTAQSLKLLGQLYTATHQFAQVVHAYQRALALFEYWLGPTHQQIADTLILIAEFYGAHGDTNTAKRFYRQAGAVQEAVVGPNHPKLAQTLILIARFYEGCGEPSQAEPLYARALQIDEAALAPHDPQLAQTLIVVADFYRTHESKEQPSPQRPPEQAQPAQSPSGALPSSTTSSSGSRQLSTPEGMRRLRAIEYPTAQIERQTPDRIDRAKDEVVARHLTAMPHAAVATDAAQQTRKQFLEKLTVSLTECSAVYFSIGADEEGERLFQEALGILHELYGRDSSEIQKAFYLHAERLRRSGKAEPARALEIRVRTLRQAPEAADTSSAKPQ